MSPAVDPGAPPARAWRLALLALLILGALLGGRDLIRAADLGYVLTAAFDSWTPMIRALDLLRGSEGAALYERLFFAEQTKFQYPPTSLLPIDLLGAIMPLSLANLNLLNLALALLNAAALALLTRFVFRAAPTPAFDLRWLPALAFAAALLFQPFTRAFVLGQIQIWIDLAVTLACLLWWTGRRGAAGVLIGLACAIKPQFGMLLLWALLWRRWDFVAGFLAAALPVAAISVLRFGWHNHLTYLEVLSFIARHGESFHANNSVNGIVNRLLFNGPNLTWDPNAFAPYHPVVHAATLLASLAFLALPLLPALLWRRGQPRVFDFGFALLCFTMASPIAWEHHYGVMLPLYVLALRFTLVEAPAASRPRLLTLLALSWVLAAGRIPLLGALSGTPLNILQAHLFLGAALLLGVLGVAVYRRQDARAPASDAPHRGGLSSPAR
ncbi:DUF2029 domain-containing protein [Roseomonas hellenica]|uniref:DUF2029 domain-containing protein n=1 Tax=Plastoroseomonas hellenica TaxID=2687306 RepID=A0ABS5F4M5_9PROT|nr:glycosyltransferase family 87 protein [Plastoroseomonas hellenica]MBR0667451.1 DUF2029 domain-containing protein [Plastoroseomonas hellenica]